MTIYYQDDAVTLLLGDAATVCATLEPQSIQTVVTSPPYFGLRDYGVEGQLGAEESPAEFVSALVSVFDAIRPALKDDGTLWVNLGDSYSSGGASRSIGRNDAGRDMGGGGNRVGSGNPGKQGSRPTSGEPAAKNLMGIPWRFAIAMQDAGWILRNDIIWAKPNPMPSSVTDRVNSAHEHLFLFAKRPRYYFDLDPIRRPAADATVERSRYPVTARSRGARGLPGEKREEFGMWDATNLMEKGGNPGDVWTLATKPFPGAHFATFPPELPERCILAGSRPGDTVLDPFSGSGTTGMVAGKHGRRYVGIDLNAEYHQLALKTRLAQGVLT